MAGGKERGKEGTKQQVEFWSSQTWCSFNRHFLITSSIFSTCLVSLYFLFSFILENVFWWCLFEKWIFDNSVKQETNNGFSCYSSLPTYSFQLFGYCMLSLLQASKFYMLTTVLCISFEKLVAGWIGKSWRLLSAIFRKGRGLCEGVGFLRGRGVTPDDIMNIHIV